MNKNELIRELSEAIPGVDFVNQKDLVSGGFVDSLGIITIIMTISSLYNIDIPLDEMEMGNFESVETMMEMITKLKTDIATP